ncbi:MAG: cardiolipin synthase [Eubacteriales bacterium]
MLCSIAEAHLFTDTGQTYFPLGEDLHPQMLEDLRKAEKFIYMEYFIIEEGKFWNSILDILKAKAAAGVDVKVVYDDVGCMMTLPGDYCKILRSYGVEATPFSRLRGNADSEFNNRSHRKITVIDGKVGYTGGINLADEYINEFEKHGHWKDIAIRLEGEAVWELTKLFLIDFGINVKKMPDIKEELFPAQSEIKESGYMIPFGDGPHPLYQRRVGKSVIQNMLSSAVHCVYMTTPYLIIDNDLCQSIENAALRGVDVRIIVPHIPDKKLVFGMTRSFYKRLMDAGVKIYEYEPGFIHAKSYLADDEYAMIGTINLDYRSLVHHFENGVWMYRCESIAALKCDIEATLEKSIKVTPEMMKTNLIQRFIRAVVRIFAPML